MRRHGIPLCTGRGTSAYAVNEESPSPIGPGALQAPGHPRAAAAGGAGPGPAALVIGTAAVKTVLPEIPPETLAEWQRAGDLTARLARVPASLIIRTERPKHTVLVSSRTKGNPYDVGCFRHQLLLPRPYLVLTKPLRLDIQCQRAASVKIGWKYLDD